MKIDWELVLAIATMLLLTVLALSIFVIGMAHAAGCLSLDVPAQAVLYNHDGDTFALFSVVPGGVVKFRVQGVNTPEISRKKGVPDELNASEAKEFTRQWLARGPFQLVTCGKPTLDRIEAIVSRNGRTLAQDILDAHLAK